MVSCLQNEMDVIKKMKVNGEELMYDDIKKMNFIFWVCDLVNVIFSSLILLILVKIMFLLFIYFLNSLCFIYNIFFLIVCRLCMKC